MNLSPCGWPKMPDDVKSLMLADVASAPINIREIQLEVCARFKMHLHDMLSDRRDRRVAHPRMIAMARCIDETYHSYPEVGRAFRRDHTTVMHAYKKFGKGLRGKNGAA